MNPLFRGIAANDSKDLILFLYETMHNEINKPNQYKPNNNYNNAELQMFRNNFYSKNSSFLIKTFYFEQQSDLKCLYCQFSKISYNITNIFVFQLEKVREYLIKKSPNGFASVTLENCFENYQEPEVLSGMNQIYCSNCRRQANASTRNRIFTSPEVMTIILNRGKGLEFNFKFEYPLIINLDKFVQDKNSNNKYELIGVLAHIGPSGMAGHFIAFCKSPVNGNWYFYNDADVQQVVDPRIDNKDQIESTPYALFYQKYETDKKIQSFALNKSLDNNKTDNKNKINNSSLLSNKNTINRYRKEKEQKISYNNLNQLTIYFSFGEMECYLDLNENERFSEIIKKLNEKFRIPKNVILCYIKGNNMNILELNSTPKYYNLNRDRIIILDN